MGRKKVQQKEPARPSFKFWLTRKNELDAYLIEMIAYLKKRKQFTSTVRDGMHLILSLREGRTSVLETLFPRVVRELVESHHSRELESLRSEIKELRDRVGVAAVAPAGPKPLAPLSSGSKMILPTLDEDDGDGSTLVLKKSTGTNSAQNFMSTLGGLITTASNRQD